MLSRTALLRSRPVAWTALLACLAATWSFDANAEPKTVCTVTINSPDEKEMFQRHLPREEYRFVELVQRGQPDWLESARRRGVKCDALIISGHFDDGTEFYTDRHDNREFLTVHEMQHASCSASGNGLFSKLKEVYLFGCNTLQSNPRHVASAEVARSLVRSGHSQADAARVSALLNERYGQSNRDRLRHVFKDVPVLYGFSSKAPLGRYAGPMLERYFKTAPAGEVATGRVSQTLLSIFGPTSMIAVAGLTDADPHASFRQDMCGFADDRPSDAQKIAFMHEVLRRDVAEVEEQVGVDPELGLRGHAAGGEHDRPAERRQHHGHHDRGDEAGHHQVVDGQDARHAQGVDLLGHLHRADLGGDAGADPGRQHHPGQGRREVGDDQGEELRADLGQVAGDPIELQAGLVDHHHADEPEGDGDEEDRLVADRVHLTDDLAARPTAADQPGDRRHEDAPQLEGGAAARDRRGAEPLDPVRDDVAEALHPIQ